MKRERETHSRTREEIAEYITEHPGVSFKLLTNLFNMNPGTLRYHLDYLEGSERIKMVKRKNQKCYYSENVGAIDPTKGDSDLNPHQRKLLRLIKDRPGITRKELMEIARQSRQELNYNLRRLKEKKVIWKTADGGDPCYEYISKEQLAAEMMAIIIEKFLDDEIDRDTFLALRNKLENDLDT